MRQIDASLEQGETLYKDCANQPWAAIVHHMTAEWPPRDFVAYELHRERPECGVEKLTVDDPQAADERRES